MRRRKSAFLLPYAGIWHEIWGELAPGSAICSSRAVPISCRLASIAISRLCTTVSDHVTSRIAASRSRHGKSSVGDACTIVQFYQFSNRGRCHETRHFGDNAPLVISVASHLDRLAARSSLANARALPTRLSRSMISRIAAIVNRRRRHRDRARSTIVIARSCDSDSSHQLTSDRGRTCSRRNAFCNRAICRLRIDPRLPIIDGVNERSRYASAANCRMPMIAAALTSLQRFVRNSRPNDQSK